MATLTINTTAVEDARIASAVGLTLRLTNADGTMRSATGLEVKQYIIGSIRDLVRQREAEAAAASFVFSALTPT